MADHNSNAANPMDAIYAQLIDTMISIIGYEAAWQALNKEVTHRLDATMRQALSMDGAYAKEAAEIVREFPGWGIRFRKSEGGGFSAEISSSPGDPEAERNSVELGRRLREAQAKYNQVQIPGVGVSLTVKKVPAPVDDPEDTGFGNDKPS